MRPILFLFCAGLAVFGAADDAEVARTLEGGAAEGADAIVNISDFGSPICVPHKQTKKKGGRQYRKSIRADIFPRIPGGVLLTVWHTKGSDDRRDLGSTQNRTHGAQTPANDPISRLLAEQIRGRGLDR